MSRGRALALALFVRQIVDQLLQACFEARAIHGVDFGRLEGQPYLSGREFGLADIGYVPWILRGLDRFGLELGLATADWLERCSERPGVAAERAVVSAL